MHSDGFAIGIDLGTSHSALARVDLRDADGVSAACEIPQQEGRDRRVVARSLPSFLYFPAEKGVGPVAGLWAREESTLQADRVVHSAKSWLCHPAVDREGKLLPWQSEVLSAEMRVSPVEASAAYLRHLREVWDAEHPEAPMVKQRVAVTVPASFDAAAQQLTLEAAVRAGLPEGTLLLEEPQAAFTRWMEAHGHGLEQMLGDLLGGEALASILVCDIGGGTTDFSLFTVRPGDPPQVRRVAVSEHLLLGGDNLDRFLAHHFRRALEADSGGSALSARQWAFLVAESRRLKEALFTDGMEVADRLVLPGSGSGLMSGTRSVAVDAAGLRAALLENFFPMCEATARPLRARAGLREMGLPYAKDGAVTRHLAAFLQGRGRVDAVLFNGGTLLSPLLRERLLDSMAVWLGGRPQVLDNPESDLAVARGAAAYIARLHRHERPIEGGTARAVYLETVGRKGGESRLLCVLPQGAPPEKVFRVDAHPLRVLVDTPVRFQAYDSIQRGEDAEGDLLEFDPDMFHALPPMQTLIAVKAGQPRPANNLVEVAVEARVNAGGLLRVALVSVDKKWKGKGRWELMFNLRVRDVETAMEEDGRETLHPKLKQAISEIEAVFGKKADKDPRVARRLFKKLETVLGKGRKEWTRQECRHLWPALAAGITRRDRSADHEAVWLNLAGFVLRPGIGAEMDGFRLGELWRLHELGLSFPREARGRTQLWILWRRVAAGLNAAQQERIAEAWLGPLGSPGVHAAELVRLAGALERVSMSTRQRWIEVMLKTLEKQCPPEPGPYYWALGRLLGRIPFGGGPETVLAPSWVVKTFEALLDFGDWAHADLTLAFLRAARVTAEPGLDLDAADRERIAGQLRRQGADEAVLAPILGYVPEEEGDRVSLFGESLPVGLTLS